MVIGSLIFVISFLGCCGALKESSCLILTFSVFLAIVFITEIGIGVVGYVKHAELKDILENHFNRTMDDYTTSIEAQHAWALVQGELQWWVATQNYRHICFIFFNINELYFQPAAEFMVQEIGRKSISILRFHPLAVIYCLRTWNNVLLSMHQRTVAFPHY